MVQFWHIRVLLGYILKKSGKKRIGKMVDSPSDAQTEVTFGLSKAGVVDPEVIDEEEKQRKKKSKNEDDE